MTKRPASSSTRPMIQLIIGFIVPTFVLFFLSGDDRLGARNAFLLALAFPIIYECYGLIRRRKPNLLSLASVLGILLIGAISLLGLNEQWLAVRRSALYVIAAVGILFVVRFKPHLIDHGLGRVLEMQHIRAKSQKDGSEDRLAQITVRAGYALSAFLIVIAAVSYVLTLAIINAPTNSEPFNAQYAELRIISIFAVTLPFIVGLTALLLYLVNAFEKLTGIDAEQLLKKKR